MASRSGGGDRATAATQSVQALQPVSSGSTGEILQCPGGGQAETFFSQVGSEFRIVGRLASVNADQNQLLVKGPERYVKLAIAPGAKIETALAGGQIVKASGNFSASGDAQATSVQPACSAPAAVAQVTAAPTPYPFPPEQTAAPAPVIVKATPKPKAVRNVTPAVAPTLRVTAKDDHKPKKHH
jgi:hypothetical protein